MYAIMQVLLVLVLVLERNSHTHTHTHTHTYIHQNNRMMGGAPQNFEENASFFQLHGLAPSAPGAKALDLGAG